MRVTIGILLAALVLCCTEAAVPRHAPGVLEVVHAFGGPDGSWCRGSLAPVGDRFFGCTSTGGTANVGTVFTMRADGRGFQTLYSFTPGTDNRLGNHPHHNYLHAMDGQLFGVALLGGEADATPKPPDEKPRKPGHGGPPSPKIEEKGDGTIFCLRTDGAGFRAVHVFGGCAHNDGSSPNSPLIYYRDGYLYGATSGGGSKKFGTLYRLKADGSEYAVIHEFDGVHGAEPHGMLRVDSSGLHLIGMTRKGGAHDAGVIFRFDPEARKLVVLHDFALHDANNGAEPKHGNLHRIGAGTTMYGLTYNGGAHDLGVLFQVEEDGSRFKVLHAFGAFPGDGAKPFGTPKPTRGALYGCTNEGGEHGQGAIFRYDLTSGEYTVHASFNLAVSGGFPEDSLTGTEDDNWMVGATQTGGPHDPKGTNFYGTIFRVSP